MFAKTSIKRSSNFIGQGLKIIKKDLVFTVSLILALVSCFIAVPKIKYIDFKVIISLFNLMIVIKAFEELQLLDKLAVSMINKCSSRKTISLVLTFLCFFTSMLITNDVALITFVPLALIISKKAGIPIMDTVIMQTLAANIGSSLTPMGNPQNLYIFSFYNLNVSEFLKIVTAVIIVGGIWLYILNMKLKNKAINVKLDEIKIDSSSKVYIWILVFLIILLSIFRIVDYRLAFILTLIAALFINKRLFMKVDYLLLMTFVCFFIFIGNISELRSLNAYLSSHLSGSTSAYFASIAASQFISNVPSSILLSHFTDKWQALLLGVNIGGVGTLIASLASLVSYKLYIKDNCEYGKMYIARFTIYNFATLALLTIIGFALL